MQLRQKSKFSKMGYILMMHFPKIRQNKSEFQSVFSKIPERIKENYFHFENDFEKTLMIINSDKEIIFGRIGRFQFKKVKTDLYSFFIFDIKESLQKEHFRGSQKWIKPNNFSFLMKIKENEIINYQTYVSLSKNSPIFHSHSFEDDLIREGFKKIIKIDKKNNSHFIFCKKNYGSNLLSYFFLHLGMISQEEKKVISKKILLSGLRLMEKENWNLSDIKLENILIREKKGKLKIKFIDWFSPTAITTNKIPIQFTQYVLALKEKPLIIKKQFECILLLLIACVEILSDAFKGHIHLMKKREILSSLEKLNSILEQEIFKKIPSETYTAIFDSPIDPQNELLNKSIYSAVCSLISTGYFLFADQDCLSNISAALD